MRLNEHLRVAHQADRYHHGCFEIVCRDDGAMSAEQAHPAIAKLFRERPSGRVIDHQHGPFVRKLVADIPVWNASTAAGGHHPDWLDWSVGDGERHDRMRVAMAYRHHIGPRLVNAAMNEALRIDRAIRVVEPVAVEVKLDDVLLGDQTGAARAGQE